jgi:hypothetical protein
MFACICPRRAQLRSRQHDLRTAPERMRRVAHVRSPLRWGSHTLGRAQPVVIAAEGHSPIIRRDVPTTIGRLCAKDWWRPGTG